MWDPTPLGLCVHAHTQICTSSYSTSSSLSTLPQHHNTIGLRPELVRQEFTGKVGFELDVVEDVPVAPSKQAADEAMLQLLLDEDMAVTAAEEEPVPSRSPEVDDVEAMEEDAGVWGVTMMVVGCVTRDVS